MEADEEGLTKERWDALHNDDGSVKDEIEVYRLVYFGGVQHEIRKDVWPYLLGHYSFGSTTADRLEVDETTRNCYEQKVGAWMAVEAIVRQLDIEKTAHAVAKLSSESGSDKHPKGSVELDADIENDVFEENCFSDLSDPEDFDEENADGSAAGEVTSKEPVTVAADLAAAAKPTRINKSSTDSGNVADEEQTTAVPLEIEENCFAEPSKEVSASVNDGEAATGTLTVLSSTKSTPTTSSYETVANDFAELGDDEEQPTIILVDDEHEFATIQPPPPPQKQHHASVIITNASIDIVNVTADDGEEGTDGGGDVSLTPLQEEISAMETLETLQEPKSACVSPASSGGGVYSVRFFDSDIFHQNVY